MSDEDAAGGAEVPLRVVLNVIAFVLFERSRNMERRASSPSRPKAGVRDRETTSAGRGEMADVLRRQAVAVQSIMHSEAAHGSPPVPGWLAGLMACHVTGWSYGSVAIREGLLALPDGRVKTVLAELVRLEVLPRLT